MGGHPTPTIQGSRMLSRGYSQTGVPRQGWKVEKEGLVASQGTNIYIYIYIYIYRMTKNY